MPLLTSTERVGTVVAGRYRVLSVIGRGGMAVVFEALRMSDGERVALKLPRAELTDDTRAERLAQEGGVTARVQHPHVVAVLDSGRAQDGLPFLVLEYLEGEDLSARLERDGPLRASEALALLLPIAGGLAVAHRAGVIHRDLKPGNIFLHRRAGDGVTPKLLDFGLARLAEAGRLTRSGTAVGTPDYMPPEQAAGERATAATDVWSLSAVLYRCLAGQPPSARTDGDNAPCCGAATALELAIARGLRRDPGRRYACVEQWAEAVVEAAVADGIALPHEPDPIGLADYHRWVGSRLSQSTLSQEVTGKPEPGWSGRVWPFVATLSVLCVLAWLAWTGVRDRRGRGSDTAASSEQTLPDRTREARAPETRSAHDDADWGRAPGAFTASTGIATPVAAHAPAAARSFAPTAEPPAVGRQAHSRPAQVDRARRRLGGVPAKPTERPADAAVRIDAGVDDARGIRRDFGALPSLKTTW